MKRRRRQGKRISRSHEECYRGDKFRVQSQISSQIWDLASYGNSGFVLGAILRQSSLFPATPLKQHLNQTKMSSKRKDPSIPSSLAEVPPAESQSWPAYLKSLANFRGNIGSLSAPSFIISGTSLTEYSAYWVPPTLLKASYSIY
jgi:hypothetical protein